MRRAYFDWNASAPLSPAARAAMAAHLERAGGAGLNPSSQHAEGRAARAALEQARRQVAGLIGAAAEEVLFTSGATEAANMAIMGGWGRILVSAIEHDCVLGAARRAAERGADVTLIPASPSGVVDLAALERLLAAPAERGAQANGRALVAVMAANNETGAIQPVAEVVRLAHAAGAAALVDAAQAAGKTVFDFHGLGADLALISGHKLGGPSGIGALAARAGMDVPALMAGGGQEQRRRPGTENLSGAVGFGAAAADIDPARWAELAPLRDRLEAILKNEAKDLVFFAEGVNRLPNTCCLAAPGWRAETQLMRLDLAGVAVSAGSACSSGKMVASHVLGAMGCDEALAACAIRISIGPGVDAGAVEAFAAAWLALRADRPGAGG